MVVGDGLLARALAADWAARADVCVFASGVSDSACTDPRIFERERALLDRTLHAHRTVRTFLYFGTCSANAPADLWTAYTGHKVAMEARVLAHPGGRVIRLPQIAGPGGNPRSLLNHLSQRLVSGDEIALWTGARRRVLDVNDLPGLLAALLDEPAGRPVVDLAPPVAHRIDEIVGALEAALGCQARCRRVDRGHDEPADSGLTIRLAQRCGVRFEDDYLGRTVMRHYRRPTVTT